MTENDPANRQIRALAEFEAGDDVTREAAVAAYGDDGVVCLRNAFAGNWLALIERGIARALDGASENLDVVKKSGDAGRFSVSSQAWRQVKTFRDFIFDSPLADLAWPFLDSKYMSLFYDFLLIKEANSSNAATPWHQDHAYYPLRGTRAINCWIALDPIPPATALRFFRGSHKPAILYRAVNFENEDQDYAHVRKARPAKPDIDNDRDAEILSAAMNPGDMLVWNSYTFHSAPGNPLDRRRAAFSVNWLGDDITYDETPALATYLDPGLKTGDRVISEKFPLVRGRAD